MGNTAQDCAKALADAGADIVGTNCGELDPLQMAEIISYMKKTVSVPLIAQPNAGRAKLVNKNAVYDMPPADFARGAVKCIEAGASLVGGCCGTSPAHIQALADLIKK